MKIEKINRAERAVELDRRVSESIPALAEIHRLELFVELGFKTMADYLKSKGKSYLSSWQMMAAIEVQESIPDIKIPSVSAGLELKKVEMPQRRQVAQEASDESAGKMTAKAIKNVVASLPERRKLSKDGTGMDIPPEIQMFWNRNEEIDHLLSMVRQTRRAVELGRENADKIFNGVDTQGVVSKLRGVEEELACAKSFAVCPECNGIIDVENCQVCRKRGTLSKFWYDRLPEDGAKKLRE